MITLYRHKLKNRANLRKRKYRYHMIADETGIEIVMFKPRRCYKRFPYAEFKHFLYHEIHHMILDEKIGSATSIALDNLEEPDNWKIS